MSVATVTDEELMDRLCRILVYDGSHMSQDAWDFYKRMAAESSYSGHYSIAVQKAKERAERVFNLLTELDLV